MYSSSVDMCDGQFTNTEISPTSKEPSSNLKIGNIVGMHQRLMTMHADDIISNFRRKQDLDKRNHV